MKVFATRAALVMIGAMTVAGAAQGQEAAAVKKAPIQEILPTAYGKVELRHTTSRTMKRDETIKDRATILVSPVLGATFFDGKMDSNVTLGVRKKNGETTVDQDQPIWNTSVEAFKNDYFSFDPYVELYAPGKNYGVNYTTTNVDGAAIVSTSMTATAPALEGSLGKFTGSFVLDPNATLNNREQKISAESKIASEDLESFGLAPTKAGASTVEVTQNEPTYNVLYRPILGFNPAVAPKLKLAFSSLINTEFNPKYEIVEEAGAAEQNKVGYTRDTSVQHRYTLSYDFGNGLSIYNQVRQNMEGLYEARAGGKEASTRWQNRLGLTFTAF